MTAMQHDADSLGIRMDQMGMDMDMTTLDGTRPFDPAFLDMMIPHHEVPGEPRPSERASYRRAVRAGGGADGRALRTGLIRRIGPSRRYELTGHGRMIAVLSPRPTPGGE